jgi:arsenate reductase
MNIQIFGSKKDNDTKKAQRFFKERGIRFQYIDLREKTLSKGEFRSVAAVNGGLEGMINKECNDRDALALVTYIAEEDKLDKILENSDRSQWPTGDTGISAGCVEDVGIKEVPMNQDTLNKIKLYKNSKYVWCAVGGVAGFLIGIYRAALFKVLIFCVVCAVGVILFAILAIVYGIAFVVARDIQRWRDQTEFLEDIMQVLGDKEQN